MGIIYGPYTPPTPTPPPLLDTTITIANIEGSGAYGYDNGALVGVGGAMANTTFQLEGFGNVLLRGIASFPFGGNNEGFFATDKWVFTAAVGQVTATIEVNGVEYAAVVYENSPNLISIVQAPFLADMTALEGQTVSFKILEII
jgi:hypothetical protein